MVYLSLVTLKRKLQRRDWNSVNSSTILNEFHSSVKLSFIYFLALTKVLFRLFLLLNSAWCNLVYPHTNERFHGLQSSKNNVCYYAMLHLAAEQTYVSLPVCPQDKATHCYYLAYNYCFPISFALLHEELCENLQ